MLLKTLITSLILISILVELELLFELLVLVSEVLQTILHVLALQAHRLDLLE